MYTRITLGTVLSLFIVLCAHASTEISPTIKPVAAKQTASPNEQQAVEDVPDLVEKRVEKEEKIPPNFFAITFYKPSYVLPLYYTQSPYDQVYLNSTPNDESIKRTEMKYQLSFKVPLWKNILGLPSNLYLAYTQLSYWQSYNNTAFFRETDYEPELFLANQVDISLLRSWHINFLNVGAVHQSNGFGGYLERSWNRIYLEAISSTDNWMFSVKPWLIIQDHTMREHNPNIANYLGYGQITIAYKYGHHIFSLSAHNIFEMGAKHATGEFSWSFPLTPYLNGYLQLFNGYGQSLIEYPHHTTSIGLGVALSNWV